MFLSSYKEGLLKELKTGLSRGYSVPLDIYEF